MKAEASWDSTVHECGQLSRVTAAEQRVYLTVKAVLQLSHPAHMQLVLRKRICVSVAGRQVSGQQFRSQTAVVRRILRADGMRLSGFRPEPAEEDVPPQQRPRLRGHLRDRFQHPRSEYSNTRQLHDDGKKHVNTARVFLQDIHGPEDREVLARLAASTEDNQSADSEAAIEKYLRSVLAVENILTMDRLRQVGHLSCFPLFANTARQQTLPFANVQEVAVREHLAAKGKAPRRCLSSPNVSLVSPAGLLILLHFVSRTT